MISWKLGTRLSDVAQGSHFWEPWSITVPPGGIRVAGFIPGSEITLGHWSPRYRRQLLTISGDREHPVDLVAHERWDSPTAASEPIPPQANLRRRLEANSATGTIRGRVRSGLVERREFLEIDIRQNGAWASHRLKKFPNGWFEIRNIKPGTYRLVIYDESRPDLILYDSGDLRVSADQMIRPLELRDLIVGCDLFVQEIQILDSAGQPFFGVDVGIEGASWLTTQPTDYYGFSKLIVRRGETCVVVADPDYRSGYRRAKREIQLDAPTTPIRIQLEPKAPR